MGKYDPLLLHLQASTASSVTLSFREIERIIGEPLPPASRTYAAFWYGAQFNRWRSMGWQGRLRTAEEAVAFTREVVTLRAPAPKQAAPTIVSAPQAPEPGKPDLIFVGCVKTKRKERQAARDLYISTLFDGRRAYAEAMDVPWYILSAKYGLVAPGDEIDPYDVSLYGASAREREEWALRVLAAIDVRLGSLSGKSIEIHAGYEYRVPLLLRGLERRGARVVVPLEGLPFGQQLSWYGQWRTAGPPQPRSRSRQSEGRALQLGPLQPELDVAALARMITEDFHNGALDLTARPKAPEPGWASMPECAALRELREGGATPVQIRCFITLMSAMDRARDADLAWRNGARLFRESPWIFDPEEIGRRSFADMQEALRRSGVSQRHTGDSDAWSRIAGALADDRSPESVRRVVFHGIGDARELRRDLPRVRPDGRTWYPFLSGPKISGMWIRIMAEPGGSSITNLDILPVAVDVQVRKITEYLGVSETRGMDLERARAPIQDAWHPCVEGVEAPGPLAGTSAGLDPALWFYAKWGCTFCERAGRRMPVGRACYACRVTP